MCYFSGQIRFASFCVNNERDVLQFDLVYLGLFVNSESTKFLILSLKTRNSTTNKNVGLLYAGVI